MTIRSDGRATQRSAARAASLAVVCLLAAGCSGSGGSSATTSPTPTGSGSSAASPGATASGQGKTSTPTVKGAPGDATVTKVQRGTALPTPTIKAPSAKFTGKVSYSDGVSVSVRKVSRGVEQGQGPGVFPGRKYVVLDLELTNGSKAELNLNQVVVTALAGKPAKVVNPVYIASAQAQDFSGALAAGASARATYAFAMSPRAGDPVTVVVDFDGAHTSATFAGPLGA